MRCNEARENLAAEMKETLMESGIILKSSCAFTPEQNGVVERKNRTIIEEPRIILKETKLAKSSFWAKATQANKRRIGSHASKKATGRDGITSEAWLYIEAIVGYKL